MVLHLFWLVTILCLFVNLTSKINTSPKEKEKKTHFFLKNSYKAVYLRQLLTKKTH